MYILGQRLLTILFMELNSLLCQYICVSHVVNYFIRISKLNPVYRQALVIYLPELNFGSKINTLGNVTTMIFYFVKKGGGGGGGGGGVGGGGGGRGGGGGERGRSLVMYEYLRTLGQREMAVLGYSS